MQPESAKFLSDILEAVLQIQGHTAGLSRDRFVQNRLVRDAVNWNFAVIGEALSQLRKADPALAEQINEWRRVIAFRNQLIHGYGVIKTDITWNVVEEKLPVLLADVRRLLMQANNP